MGNERKEQTETKSSEDNLSSSSSKPHKRKKGRIYKRILAVVLVLVGLAIVDILSKYRLIPTRGHVIVLIFGISTLSTILWVGENVIIGVIATIAVTAMIILLFQMQYLPITYAPFAGIVIILVVAGIAQYTSAVSNK